MQKGKISEEIRSLIDLCAGMRKLNSPMPRKELELLSIARDLSKPNATRTVLRGNHYRVEVHLYNRGLVFSGLEQGLKDDHMTLLNHTLEMTEKALKI